MKRPVAFMTAVTAVGLIVAITATPAAPDQRSPSFRQLMHSTTATLPRAGHDVRRLVFVEHNATEADVDNAPAGLSAGDEVALDSVLMRDGKRLGRFDLHAVYTYVREEPGGMLRALLNATASLPAGEIEVQGVAVFKVETAEFNFAVVGGTRRYEGAEGGFHVVERGDTIKYVFDLELH